MPDSNEIKKSKRGGARVGAGRKPKLEISAKAKTKLSVKQQRVVLAKVGGASDRAAVRAAGYAETTARAQASRVVDNPAVRSEFQRLMAKVIPDELIVGKLRAGLNATRKTYAMFDGSISDERRDPDYQTQHKFLDLACKIKNVIPRESSEAPRDVQIQIVHIGGPAQINTAIETQIVTVGES